MFGTRTRTVDETATAAPSPHIWSPAQLIAIAIGIGAIVFGALALTKTGLDLGHLKHPHDTFAHFHHTPFLGLIEVAFGALLLVSGFQPVVGRSIMVVLGGASATLGAFLIVDLWPRTLHRWLGAHDRNGYLFIAVGAVLLLAAFLIPATTVGGSRVVRQRVVEDEHDD
jgi:hypothetical protein